ncbi:aa3-type cytochrome oxidase subunit II [Gordonia amicalis]|uniref:aa3-type cytochrome oxidase subunit II n=1 Tax=Gordonia amicalis TaxID=89053 RepID=UPI0002A658E7|nr:cytochrome c oxidase subunit II [Gordonia amicalis]MBA5849517.1 cytochrome c oxidase subunit II [Gordonia amicalis]MCZ0913737.1 cytochrome c oxidase subunit II [Gordonia amicalis]MDV7172019.1 cytochrome c oxidase subunit II [Gordonia amicalis]NKX76950.1 cytochrome c oxidase subunit II [Gordonia amicalis]UKO90994.1 cytochrome c oxidase subunit II [Gordonia amicalis]
MKRLGIVVALGLGALLMSGCDANEAMRFGWPEGVTPQGKKMVDLWTWSVIAALVMGILVWALIFWTITFHRANDAKKGVFPRQTAYNVPLELTYTAIPFVIIAVLFYFTVIVQNDVEGKNDDSKVVVDVTAFQWNWKFGYNKVVFSDGSTYDGFEADGNPFELQQQKDGEVEPEPAVEGEHGGELPGPAGGRDDDIRDYLRFDKIETVGSSSEIPVLVLPTDKRIEFNLASGDVVHSFWVPEFLYKRDVMPFPKENSTDPIFQIGSLDRTGAFVGRCAEMCGTYHSMMNFEVRAVTPEDFDSYIRFRQSNPEATNAEALASICQAPEAVTTVPFDTRRKTDGSVGATGNPDDPTLANCTKKES